MKGAPPTRTSSRRQGNGTGNGTAVDRRSLSLSVESFHPAQDTQTYRDLLIFEERLKQNAARLVKRKKKYQTFLVLLCGVISFFGYHVFLHPQEWQPLHYLNVTILLVTATMLFLFFASGMYAERITAANKFVPQANRSLRNFNMYLNTRKAPRRSLFSLIFLSRAKSPTTKSHPIASSLTADNPSIGEVRQAMAQQTGIGRRMHIPAIPPTSNPRGELIFSPKVTTSFREGYERYRAAFERRRRQKLDERRWRGWRKWWRFENSRDRLQDPLGASGKGGQARSGAAVAPIKGSPRVTKTRTRSATNTSLNSLAGSEASSRASSRAGSPSRSPIASRRTRKGDDPLPEEDEVSIGRRGRDRTPSVTAILLDPVTNQAGEIEEQTKTQDAIAPDPSSVANTADDRSAPEATLREPDSADAARIEEVFVE